jgi:surface polysaccharide O-acyltransferase-like enzyme
VNLSVADLLVTLICMPVAISQAVIKIWLYGEFMCRVTYYLQGEYLRRSTVNANNPEHFSVFPQAYNLCVFVRHVENMHLKQNRWKG